MDGRESRALTRGDLQRWLNDHVGERLSVAVVVTDTGPFVLAGHGELRPWSQHAPGGASSVELRHDIAGLYKIGDWSLDVTELDESCAGQLTPLGQGAEQVEILLAEEVSLEITRPSG